MRISDWSSDVCSSDLVDRTGGTQSGIFSKAVPGDEIGLVRKPDTAVLLEHPERRDRVGHDRGLRILGQRQVVGRPFAHQPEQILAERLLDQSGRASGRARVCQYVEYTVVAVSL